MKRIPTTYKLVATSLAFTVAVVGAFGLYIVVHGQNQSISQTNADLEFALAREQQLRGIKSIVEDTASARTRLSERFVSPDGTVDFLERIEELAAAAGVAAEISSVNIESIESVDGRPLAKEQLELLEVTVAAEGSWDEVYHFLALAETLPFFVETERVVVRKNDSVAATAPWTTTFTLRVAKQK